MTCRTRRIGEPADSGAPGQAGPGPPRDPAGAEILSGQVMRHVRIRGGARRGDRGGGWSRTPRANCYVERFVGVHRPCADLPRTARTVPAAYERHFPRPSSHQSLDQRPSDYGPLSSCRCTRPYGDDASSAASSTSTTGRPDHNPKEQVVAKDSRSDTAQGAAADSAAAELP